MNAGTEMTNEQSTEMDEYIKKRYEKTISYYWASSVSNKRWYKLTRSMTVILGALVTLSASLSSSTMLGEYQAAKSVFDLATPVMAATLAIIAGFSQSFQWGSTWQNMVLTAQQLQGDYDAYLVTPQNEKDYSREVTQLNTFVIAETEGFFDTMLGVSRPRYKR